MTLVLVFWTKTSVKEGNVEDSIEYSAYSVMFSLWWNATAIQMFMRLILLKKWVLMTFVLGSCEVSDLCFRKDVC